MGGFLPSRRKVAFLQEAIVTAAPQQDSNNQSALDSTSAKTPDQHSAAADPAGTNPLVDVPFSIPFPEFSAEQIEPAIETLIERSDRRITALEALPSPVTYANLIDPLERASDELDLTASVIGHLESVHSTPQWREAYNAIQQPLSLFSSRVTLSEPLWKLLKAFSTSEQIDSLSSVEQRYVSRLIDGFKRQGAELSPDKKERLKAIDVELAEVTTKFAQNTLDATNAPQWLFADASRLQGLPPTALDGAAQSARDKGLSGYRLTLHAPSYIAAMTYLEDSSLREELYRAYVTRASSGATDNAPHLLRTLELRRERAELLGFSSFADLVLDDRMAKKGETARTFLTSIKDRVAAQAAQENTDLLAFRRSLEGPDAPELKPWDVPFYAEKQRQALYHFDEEIVRGYFPLEVVQKGVFDCLNKLYGVSVTPATHPVWHPDVRAYDMRDGDGHLIGSFYTDLFPRESKRGGAWMGEFIHGRPEGESGSLTPHLGYVCANFTPPTDARPSLLTHDEVNTLFHEFGHLMHHLLSEVPIPSIGGTKVAWDFVELPSQIMENWTWEPEVINMLSSHFQTGEKMPKELFEKMAEARNFRSANFLMRQIGFGLLDLALHIDYQPQRDGDLLTYCRTLAEPFSPTPLTSDYATVTTFSHLFSSPVGYGAGYYSYLWAEVLDADAYSRFEKEGIFNRTTGTELREKVLSKGNSEDPMKLFTAFMGREPSIEALLRRAGIVASDVRAAD